MLELDVGEALMRMIARGLIAALCKASGGRVVVWKPDAAKMR
ncbi:hypothetical protein [Stenotrophomonas sp. UBA7606]|nr:hypothetical protein [Stenotrophomonas sp. UBA7606]